MGLGKLLVNGRKTINYLQKNGLMHTFYAAKERLEQGRGEQYSYVEPTEEEWKRQKAEFDAIFEGNRLQENTSAPVKCPIFSLLVPAYETKKQFLEELLDSMLGQSYVGWELVLVDASSSDVVINTLEEYHKTHNQALEVLYLNKDSDLPYYSWNNSDTHAGEPATTDLPHKCLYLRKENQGISENTNAGLPYCRGDYICLVDHDDVLTPDALYYMAKTIMENCYPTMVYSDEDKTNTDRTLYYDPNDKYKFNYDLILSNNYICHLTAVNTELFQTLTERKEYDGAQDYDLVLRVVATLVEQYKKSQANLGGKKGMLQYLQSQILHIPRVLYHWRCHVDSTAENTASKRYAYEAGKRAVEDYFKQQGIPVEVEHSLHLGFYDTQYISGIMDAREDIGVIGGRILDEKKCMLPCIRNEQGEYLYVGLHKEYSGRMHRFSLRQDVGYVDVRNMIVRKELKAILEDVMGVELPIPWDGCHLNGMAYTKMCLEKHKRKPDWERLSTEFCDKVREKGYTIVYDPAYNETSIKNIDV